VRLGVHGDVVRAARRLRHGNRQRLTHRLTRRFPVANAHPRPRRPSPALVPLPTAQPPNRPTAHRPTAHRPTAHRPAARPPGRRPRNRLTAGPVRSAAPQAPCGYSSRRPARRVHIRAGVSPPADMSPPSPTPGQTCTHPRGRQPTSTHVTSQPNIRPDVRTPARASTHQQTCHLPAGRPARRVHIRAGVSPPADMSPPSRTPGEACTHPRGRQPTNRHVTSEPDTRPDVSTPPVDGRGGSCRAWDGVAARAPVSG
jgi:hypothetical protein